MMASESVPSRPIALACMLVAERSMALLRSISCRLVAAVALAVLALSSPVATAQTRSQASLWLGAGIGGKLDGALSVSVGVQVQGVGVVFYEALDFTEVVARDLAGAALGLGPTSRRRDYVRGFDLLYFTGLTRQVVAYTGGGYYFEKGCAVFLDSNGQCRTSYSEKHFAYSVGVHYSPRRFVVGYGYHTFRGHEITVGVRF